MVLNLLHVGKSKFKDKVSQAKIAAGILDNKIYSGPWEVQIDLTNTCNNDCVGCWCHSPLLEELAMPHEQKKKKLPYKLVLKLIDDLYKIGTRYIYFTGGGDPWAHPKTIEIIEYVKKKGLINDMSTNFSLVTKDKAKRFVKSGLDHMNISLWAGSAKSYDDTHPNKTGKDFEKLVDMLRYVSFLKKKFNKKKPIIHIYNVISTKNYWDFENMLKTAYKTKVNGIDFTPTDVIPGKTDSLMLSREQADWLIDKVKNCKKLMDKFELEYNHKIEFRGKDHFIRRLSNLHQDKGEYDSNIIGKIPCYAGWTFLRILADGNVNSCLKSVRIPIGNIYENSIKNIWKNKNQQEFRKHTLNYNVKNPYFENIGNEHQKGNGCLLCCDNLGINMAVHGELSKLGPMKKKLMKLGKYL
jgi:MoaA/NifB/PqqE/SkfB family radical SAM enzyme